MKLTRVKLHGFGAFNQGLDVAFSPENLTMVVGRNEAGKSTLLNSVFGVLFGFRDLNLVRKYEPWDDHEAYAGELELQVDEGTTAGKYRIFRDFKTNEATIDRIESADESESHPHTLFEGTADPRSNRDEDLRYFEELGKLLGFKDEAVFRSTVFFGQQSLHTAVSDQIRRLISGSSSVDFKGALHELHSRYSELTTENPWKSKSRGSKRLIEKTQTKLDAKEERLKAGRSALSRTLELEAEIAGLESTLGSTQEDIATQRKSLEAHEVLQGLLGRREEAERRYEDTLTRRDNQKRYTDRAREVDQEASQKFSQFRNVPDNFPEQVRAYAQDQAEMQKELDTLARERKDLEHISPKPNGKNGMTIGTVVGGSAFAAGALTPVGLVAGAIAGAAGGLLGYNIGRNVGTGFKEDKARIAQRIATLQDSVKARRKRSEEVLATAGSSLLGRSPEEVIAEYKGFQQLREEKKRLVAAVKALGDRNEVAKAFDEASNERGAVEASFSALMADHPSMAGVSDRKSLGKTIEDLRQSLSHIEARTTSERSRLEDARVELAGLGSRIDGNLTSLHEDVLSERNRLEKMDLERDALKEAIDTLDQCVKDFQEGDVYRLSEEMSTIFAKITGEKYTRIHLGASLEPIISRGDDVPISPEHLSQGAQDQLYFAMRVAMARHLSKDIRLPLFLDDPFVNFDEERLTITKDVLNHLDDHQVIMVTCNRDYESWSETILDLDKVRNAA